MQSAPLPAFMFMVELMVAPCENPLSPGPPVMFRSPPEADPPVPPSDTPTTPVLGPFDPDVPPPAVNAMPPAPVTVVVPPLTYANYTGWIRADYLWVRRPAAPVATQSPAMPLLNAPSRPRSSQRSQTSSSRGYIRGPRGGCYYINRNGTRPTSIATCADRHVVLRPVTYSTGAADQPADR